MVDADRSDRSATEGEDEGGVELVGDGKDDDTVGKSRRGGDCAVHKKYRCLVCVSPAGGGGGMGENATTYASAADDGAARLRRLARDGTVVRHYLEPSIRAPKRFASSNPDNNSTWLECLLRVVDVKYMVPTIGTRASERLADALWDGRTGAGS